MPLFSTASLSLFSKQEDQFVNVSNLLWQSLVPVNYTKGKKKKKQKGFSLEIYF
jgi:hypothetical protein